MDMPSGGSWDAVALLLSILAIGSTMPFHLAAQIGGNGSIEGVVSDPGGGVIPGATVEARSVGTGVKSTRQTTGAGYFVLSSLPAGEYILKVSAPGFETLVQAHVIVDALRSTSGNPAMKIGATTEQ